VANENSVLILDGALGTELRARGVRVPDYKSSIWSALALTEAPDEVRRLHADYIKAGADVITVNNYAVTRKLLAREGMEDRLSELTLTAARLASEARNNTACADGTTSKVRIAGSLGPLDTTYRADLVGSFDENLTAYREVATLLAPHVDIFICETMTTADEARAAATAAAEIGKTVWVSWTLAPQGDMLRGGESPTQALNALADLPVEAVLFNCSAGDAVDNALPGLIAAANMRVGVYANPVHTEPPGGEPEVVPTAPLDPEDYAQMALAWVRRGARLVGGCCDTSPAHIARLRSLIAEEFA
jgi:S-methylmethionine-dependent homocysteine/selenocysteine methylase